MQSASENQWKPGSVLRDVVKTMKLLHSNSWGEKRKKKLGLFSLLCRSKHIGDISPCERTWLLGNVREVMLETVISFLIFS